MTSLLYSFLSPNPCDGAHPLNSLLLAGISLIPNNTLRYILLAFFACSTLLHTIHLQRPSVQLARAENQVQQTEEIIQHARSFCAATDFVYLGEQAVRLLGVKRTLSIVKCCLLEAESSFLTWKRYRLLSKDIAACAIEMSKIRDTVELLVESERQRRLTEDINNTETVLYSLQAASGGRFHAAVFAESASQA
ncbi:hypothetical protein FB45DRAFT_1020532 [Roridomyces roridus]|uniref:Uncharacterized protein n=1 Tax=Roridomyces roridus TaxID=1738132 RepID=A0AAD7FUD2_9AGAR|nr:hypothetical protein FB45DRAFT_1020532 [Roridomyces roridus]